ALAAAERQIHDGRLPGHPRRERAHGVDRFVGMKTDAAFRRPARVVVLHAEPLEHLHVAVIHADGERDVQLADGFAKHGAKSGIEIEKLGGGVELMLGDGERIQRARGIDRLRHVTSSESYAYIPRILVTVATRPIATM